MQSFQVRAVQEKELVAWKVWIRIFRTWYTFVRERDGVAGQVGRDKACVVMARIREPRCAFWCSVCKTAVEEMEGLRDWHRATLITRVSDAP